MEPKALHHDKISAWRYLVDKNAMVAVYGICAVNDARSGPVSSVENDQHRIAMESSPGMMAKGKQHPPLRLFSPRFCTAGTLHRQQADGRDSCHENYQEGFKGAHGIGLGSS